MKPKNILHIDDDRDIREITKISLENLGNYDVISCSNCAEALNELAKKIPDLILIDMVMPDIDGLETLSEIKKILISKIHRLFL